jgi:hypothetical protein
MEDEIRMVGVYLDRKSFDELTERASKFGVKKTLFGREAILRFLEETRDLDILPIKSCLGRGQYA